MEFSKALGKCMNLCSRTEYCCYDMEQKLIKWEVSKSDRERIIQRLVDEKFVDHERYIRAYVNDKIRYNHWGKRKVSYQLGMKQLETNRVALELEAFPMDEYREIAQKHVHKKLKSTKGKTPYEIKQKVARSVVSKGFDSTLVFDLIEEELKE